MKYRKKPIVIEAFQLTTEVLRETKPPCEEKIIYHERFASIDTLEGGMIANIGDWIIKGVKGEFYPVKPDIFEQTYELVTPKNKGLKMTDPKKRLKEIIEKMLDMPEFIAPDRYNINQATTEILKEFVHKDNLPINDLKKDIAKNIEYTLAVKGHLRIGGDLDKTSYAVGWINGVFKLAKTIRKLIEGKK